jgi:hypothetical protein
MMLVSEAVRPIWRATSIPDIPGIRRSRIATSGFASSIRPTASLPSRARPTISIPFSVRTSATASTTAGWSSATTMLVTAAPSGGARSAQKALGA